MINCYLPLPHFPNTVLYSALMSYALQFLWRERLGKLITNVKDSEYEHRQTTFSKMVGVPYCRYMACYLFAHVN